LNKDALNDLVKTFFTCNKEELSEIFEEMLSVVELEQKSGLNTTMSRNYSSAQANPEINANPGNLKDARDAIFPFFWGTDGWNNPLHLENVKGPANYASLIGAVACLLKNPNLCTDTYSQRSNELEVKSITALANLLFYHTESPWGVFTMGGTISNLYGGKIGLERVCPGAMQEGLQGATVCGITSQAAHYSNSTLAGWLGIGTQNLHAVPTDHNMSMRMDLLEEKMDELYQAGEKLAFVIATFGSTDAFGIDDISKIRELIDHKSKKYGVPPAQLHVDAAVGWFMTLLNEYDLEINEFSLCKGTLDRVQSIQTAAKGLRCADSVTIDFHKMGWGHYPGSAFIVNRREDLNFLFRKKSEVPYFAEADVNRDPALFTLECSRPAIGPYSVMATLNGLGLRGCQMLAVNTIDMSRKLKERLNGISNVKVLNPECIGPQVLWWVLPKGRDAGDIYDKILSGELSEENAKPYFEEIRRMYDHREESLNQTDDPRLSFTTSIGFCPHEIQLPAWKASFFNPATDDTIIDKIVASIEELL
jgi:L-2,4-diaminobutyrate decarboxylase